MIAGRGPAAAPDMTTTPFEAGKALHASGDLEGAARRYREAIAADGGDFRALNNLASVLEAQGEVSAAEAVYRDARAAAPDSPVIAFNLARLLQLDGRLAEAETLYRLAIERDPGMAGAHFNLGRLLQENERAPEAIESLRRTVELQPGELSALTCLGDALFAQRRLGEALRHYRDAVALAPGDAEAEYNVARTLEFMARHADAADCYRRSVELEPGNDAAREGLARALHAGGRDDDALKSLHEWLAHDPGNAVAQHLLAALGGAEAPERAADEYVRDTFDRFAADFDRTLGRLGYRAPELCAAALAAAVGEPAGALAVLDAGCGTGLCAPLLRPWARTLAGVDLSPGMLARARERGGYDTLAEGELTAHLAAHPAAWDAIVSADTFCYLGALAAPLAAAHDALVPGGWLVCTLEHDETADTFRLHDHGRYAHAESYVRAAFAQAGFETIALARETLRMESGAPVAGLVVTARRTQG